MKITLGIVLLLVCGCASGPNFERPAAPATGQYLPPPAADAAAAPASAGGQQIVLGGQVSARWWSLFGSDSLDDVVAQAINASPTLLAAKHALAQSQELVTAAGGARYPRVDASGGAGRQKYGKQFLGPLTAPPPFTYYAAGATVNYTFDASGAIAR
ncbi:MAG TPA: TolC family protein, partial [Steroidobacteraceae bacterium]